MPARPAHAPGTLPVWFARGAYLPEHEIERVLLARVIRICTSLRRERDHLLAAQPAQATVIGDTSHAEIDVALALVGMALRFQSHDQRDDLWNRLARSREDIGREHVEGRHVVNIEGRFFVSEAAQGGAEPSRPPA